jgi:hypothetical protein
MPFLCDTVRGFLNNDSSYQVGEGSRSKQQQRQDHHQEKRGHLQIPHFEAEGRSSPDEDSSSSSSSSSDEPEEWDESEDIISESPPRYYRSVLDSSRQYQPIQSIYAQQQSEYAHHQATTTTMYHKQSPPPKVFPLSLSPRLFGFGNGNGSGDGAEDVFSTGYFVPKQDAIQQQYMQGTLSRRNRIVDGRRNHSRRQSLGFTV